MPAIPHRVDTSSWVIRLVLVMDWYDGPRGGACVLSAPERERDYWFELLDERSRADDVDERLFRLFDLPVGSVDRLVARLHPLGSPSETVWVPRWSHDDAATLERLGREVEEVRARAVESEFVVRSGTMDLFVEGWIVPQGTAVADWFLYLSL